MNPIYITQAVTPAGMKTEPKPYYVAEPAEGRFSVITDIYCQGNNKAIKQA